MKLKLLNVSNDDLNEIYRIQKIIFKEDALRKDIIESLILGGLFLKLYNYNERNETIGFIAIGLTGEIIYPRIFSLGLLPEYRLKGYGSYLLTSALEKLPAYLKMVDNDDDFYKFEKLSVYIKKNSQNVRKFLQKFDFKIIDIKENYFHNGESAYYMERSLLQRNK